MKKLIFYNLPKTFDERRILRLGIPNIHTINQNGIRGESLANSRNKHFIPDVKACGIKQIIDLKTSDHSDKFQKFVEDNGIAYFHFPIDSNVLQNSTLIASLGKFFQAINNGNFYISCAQGLHRTDIGLATNFLFNRKANKIPPILYGHQTSRGFRKDDIFCRVNSLFRALKELDKAKLDEMGCDIEQFAQKKAKLLDINERYNKLANSVE